jgi:hypothetical protein
MMRRGEKSRGVGKVIGAFDLRDYAGWKLMSADTLDGLENCRE